MKYRYLVALLIVVFSVFIGRAIGKSKISSKIEETASRPVESSLLTAAEKNTLKEWFSSLLGLQQESTENADGDGTRQMVRAARAHTPQYVQNLYDRMTLETDYGDASIRRRRRSLSGGSYNFGAGENAMEIDEPATIQAVARDASLDIRNGSRNSYQLRFNLEQMWIPDQELQLAELVLAVDYSRLAGPPGSYSIYAYSVDENLTPALPSRLLVSAGSLRVLDTFRDNFVKLKVTDTIVRKLLDAGRHSVVFEIFVSFDNQNRSHSGGGGNAESKRDLDQQEIGGLLHLSSHGIHQPLLVLYSATAKALGEETEPVSRNRRRRNVPESASTHDWRHPDEECRRHEWWIDLADVFQESVIAPEGFSAYFCAGACHHPILPSRWNASGNAQLRNSYCYQQAKSGSGELCDVPKPACVAQSLLPISVVYQVGSHYIIRRLDKIVANSCMCA